MRLNLGITDTTFHETHRLVKSSSHTEPMVLYRTKMSYIWYAKWCNARQCWPVSRLQLSRISDVAVITTHVLDVCHRELSAAAGGRPNQHGCSGPGVEGGGTGCGPGTAEPGGPVQKQPKPGLP